ncbi:DUF262 domain-containing protein [Herminiimonas fonticola]|uniref:Uncharacterized protein DUF262 n=1 Tax=Herminiimonas fonticola TaxID=303380 RepID=A0A4R6GI06_9BURK|nr:DUF262 domain-containing protein [Herminiimonas fonticola]RBA25430.1 hypothetical protein Hfont_1063 [Herminiimonas fonticola]TDN94543.1 uncharacterized protein DUF262 [Herminiimonas fonticola]
MSAVITAIPEKTAAERDAAEAQIAAHHKIIDYDTREYPVEVIVDKYLDKLEEDENDFFIPDYQRDLTWPEEHQSRFIESVLMGLPIPMLFLADITGQEGRAEIVDGSQRVRTLARFMKDKLRLSGLERLHLLNGFLFSDLPPIRQRRFGRHTVRMIELREGSDAEVRRDIFGRINTGSLKLNDMEIRWGVNDGPYLQFIRELSQQPLFIELAPLSEKAVKLREPQEFVLRFFAYLDGYQNFDRSVVEFLDTFLKAKMETFNDTEMGIAKTEWDNMLAFVKAHFAHGFSKGKGHVRTPRIRYEALSVGTALALRINPNLVPASVDWLESEEFKDLMRSDASNSRPKVIRRIEFVRDKLLGR